MNYNSSERKSLFSRSHKFVSTLLLAACWFATFTASAQNIDTRVDSLENRVRRLEVRFDTAQSRIRAVFGLPRTFTRSDIEQGNYGSRVRLATQRTILEVGGFVQADVIYSFREPGAFKDAMVPASIPAPNRNIGESFLGIRQSKLTFRSYTQTALGELRTQFEFDLFAPNGATTFHIRHAWGKLGKVGFGQFWTNFMDIDVFPNIFEYWGPNSMPFIRQPQVRLTDSIGSSKYIYAISIEAPGSQFRVDTPRFSKRTVYPDVIGSFRLNWGKEKQSHLKAAALFHPISYMDSSEKKSLSAYGVTLSGLIYLYDNNNITFQATYGDGIGRYYDDIGILDYDATYNISGNLRTLPAYGAFLFYNFWWSDKFSSSVGYSFLKANTFSSQPGSDYSSGQYGVANIIYYPVNYVKMGLEFQYGRRSNINNTYGENSRLQFSANYKF